MNSPHAVVTPERFAEGMTVDQYLTYIGTPENLQREAGWMLGPRRVDFSAVLRERYERTRLGQAQVDAIRWLAAQHNGPAKILMISEEWSSDCRRDVPIVGRLAERVDSIFASSRATVTRPAAVPERIPPSLRTPTS